MVLSRGNRPADIVRHSCYTYMSYRYLVARLIHRQPSDEVHIQIASTRFRASLRRRAEVNSWIASLWQRTDTMRRIVSEESEE